MVLNWGSDVDKTLRTHFFWNLGLPSKCHFKIRSYSPLVTKLSGKLVEVYRPYEQATWVWD